MLAIHYFTVLGDMARATSQAALIDALRAHVPRLAADKDWPELMAYAADRWCALGGLDPATVSHADRARLPFFSAEFQPQQGTLGV